MRTHPMSRLFVPLLVVACAAVGLQGGRGPGPAPPPPNPDSTSTAVPVEGVGGHQLRPGERHRAHRDGLQRPQRDTSYFTSTIRSGTPGYVRSMPCATGTALRQSFNLDYTRMAVVQHNGPDGRSHIGYADATGAVTDVTDLGGVEGAERRTWPVFDARTNRLWYRTAAGFGSIDLGSPGESRDEPGRLADQPAGGSSFYLAPGGQPVEAGLHDRAFSEDGKLQVMFAPHEGLKVSAPGGSEAARGIPWAGRWTRTPLQVLDAQRVLCIGPEGASVVTFTPGYKSLSLRPVSPSLPSGTQIVDAMVSPDREHLAYLTVTSSVVSLYMKPLANDNKPVLVADAISTLGAGFAQLAEWRDG